MKCQDCSVSVLCPVIFKEYRRNSETCGNGGPYKDEQFASEAEITMPYKILFWNPPLKLLNQPMTDDDKMEIYDKNILLKIADIILQTARIRFSLEKSEAKINVVDLAENGLDILKKSVDSLETNPSFSKFLTITMKKKIGDIRDYIDSMKPYVSMKRKKNTIIKDVNPRLTRLQILLVTSYETLCLFKDNHIPLMVTHKQKIMLEITNITIQTARIFAVIVIESNRRTDDIIMMVKSGLNVIKKKITSIRFDESYTEFMIPPVKRNIGKIIQRIELLEPYLNLDRKKVNILKDINREMIAIQKMLSDMHDAIFCEGEEFELAEPLTEVEKKL